MSFRMSSRPDRAYPRRRKLIGWALAGSTEVTATEVAQSTATALVRNLRRRLPEGPTMERRPAIKSAKPLAGRASSSPAYKA